MSYLPPLHIYIVYHPKFIDGENWAYQLELWLSGDPNTYAVPTAEIPTYILTTNTIDEPPPEILFTEAERTIVIFLVDDMWMARSIWRQWAERIGNTANQAESTHEAIVVAASKSALNLSGYFQKKNAIRLDLVSDALKSIELRLRITHLLVRRMLNNKPSSIFLSHTKMGINADDNGGRSMALALQKFLQSRPLSTPFFDEVSIEAGEDFGQRLREGVEAAVVVVLLTDRFAGRFWCKWEIATAKSSRRPMLLVDALEHGEPMNLAYAGNVRTIRWDRSKVDDEAMHDKIIAGALLELLRSEHNKARVRSIGADFAALGRTEILGYSPELATLPMPDGHNIYILHPDPPLAAFEVELINSHRPEIKFASITQALAGSINGETPLKGKRIAISISDSPDSYCLGLTKLHQERLWERIASILLSAGAQLAYGGDLRKGGYTDLLWDLVRGTLDAGGTMPAGVVHSYLGWPISLELTDKDRAALPNVIELHELAMPTQLNCNPNIYIKPFSFKPPEHFAWTVSMIAMRRKMAEECDARIIVGGQFYSVSPVPGLIEEFLTFAPNKPVYLVGGFGGMAQVIGRALCGDKPRELTQGFQEKDGERKPIMDYYNNAVATGNWPELNILNFDALIQKLQSMGISCLKNGLTETENLQLLRSKDITEITSLILMGLQRYFKKHKN